MKKIAPPNVNVLTRAIERIETGRTRFTCWALFDSLPANTSNKLASMYRYQYRRHVESKNNNRTPWWWNNSYPCKEARLEALRGFKQACIDAGKKQVRG